MLAFDWLSQAGQARSVRWLASLLLVCSLTIRAQQDPHVTKVSARPVSNRISVEKERELLRSVDEMLRLVSESTRLPVRSPVQRALASRDQIREHVRARLEENTRGLRRSQPVLKKLGLLPRDFDLDAFLIEVMGEEITGYYDRRTGTIYLADSLPAVGQRPMLAHELTHALQDQNVRLELWLDEAPGPVEDFASQVEADERRTARAVLIEAQAMHVLVDYTTAAAQVWNATSAAHSRGVRLSPEYTAVFRDRPRSAALRRAPIYIQETLAFPYAYGFRFIEELRQQGGNELAFARVLLEPPRSTYEVMHPRSYLENAPIEPMRVPDFTSVLGNGYRIQDVGAIGALDVRAMLRQYAGESTANKLCKRWRGGHYYAARRSTAGSEPAFPESLALIYVSRWEREEDAARFAAAYGAAIPKRYAHAQRASSTHSAWTTEDGPVFIEVRGTTVLVMEGFDDAVVASLRDAVFAVPQLVATQ